MHFPLPEELKKLASYFPRPLYIVGGYVRDVLCLRTPSDCDLAGDTDPSEVERLLENSPFKVKKTSPKLMTLKIVSEKASYEYTAFRTDDYETGHSPVSVRRTNDINADASRRDFTANAVYLNILSGEICDPCHGCEDIKGRILRQISEKTFTEDGLRLMRLCRQAAETGFDIDPYTLSCAKKNAALIKEISPERIRDELDRILVADCRYGTEKAHVRGIRLLDETGVLQYILPEITLGKNLPQRADFHRYDVFGHILATLENAAAEIRLAALLHDVGKPYCYLSNGVYHGHDVEGERIAGDILNRLRYPKTVISETKKLVRLHMVDLKQEMRENKLRQFLQENYSLLPKLFLLKQADYSGTGLTEGTCPSVSRMKKTLAEMKEEHVPFSVKELAVNGRDLDFVPKEKRGLVLKALLRACALKNADLNVKEKQLKYISNLLKENKNG